MDQRETAAESSNSPSAIGAPASRVQSWAVVAGRLGAMTTIPHQDPVAA